MVVLFLAFLVSAAVTFFVIRSARAHAHFSADADMSGPQKFHATPVPRASSAATSSTIGSSTPASGWSCSTS
jgi:hypothetical protein